MSGTSNPPPHSITVDDTFDEHYPEAERIRVVLDNVSAHSVAALYQAFDPAHIAAWKRRRNAEEARIKWMFTVDRGRKKLGRLYPQPTGQCGSLGWRRRPTWELRPTASSTPSGISPFFMRVQRTDVARFLANWFKIALFLSELSGVG